MAGKIFLLGNDIDTDQLAPGRFMGQGIKKLSEHCLENAYPNFPKLVKRGDIIFGGKNFGTGSSREQAVEVLKFLKISVVIAQSFAGIFYRNSINLGLPAVVCYDNLHVQDGEIVDFDLKNNQLNLIEKNKSIKLESIPTNLMEILNDGGLIPHLKKRIK